jgi:hypothetical protein
MHLGQHALSIMANDPDNSVHTGLQQFQISLRQNVALLTTDVRFPPVVLFTRLMKGCALPVVVNLGRLAHPLNDFNEAAPSFAIFEGWALDRSVRSILFSEGSPHSLLQLAGRCSFTSTVPRSRREYQRKLLQIHCSGSSILRKRFRRLAVPSGGRRRKQLEEQGAGIREA